MGMGKDLLPTNDSYINIGLFQRCQHYHCKSLEQDEMAPSVLVDQMSEEPVAVVPKASDHTVIKTSHPNPSLQVTPDHKLKSVEAPVYAPGKGEVLLHIKATGVCGSDIHFWKTGRIGPLIFEGDCIIGHEASGIVLKCGEDVTSLKPGKTSDELQAHSVLTLSSLVRRPSGR